MSSEHEFVTRICPSSNAKIVVWGDMNGAFHSLARGLKRLKELDIIGEDLKLKNKDYYIAFAGDLISRSPFIMELLSVIFKLEEKNPGQIWFIAGNNERRGSWYNLGLKESFLYNAGHVDSEKNPLFKIVEKYLETLPLAVYFSIPPHEGNEFFRLSHFAINTASHQSYKEFVDILDCRYYSQTLLDDRSEGDVKYIKISKDHTEPDKNLIKIVAQVKSFKKTKGFKKTRGLVFLGDESGAVSWNVSSNPTVFVQEILKHFRDAFAFVEMAPKLKEWTITNYSRDIRTTPESPKFEVDKFNFMSGKQIEKDGKPVTVESDESEEESAGGEEESGDEEVKKAEKDEGKEEDGETKKVEKKKGKKKALLEMNDPYFSSGGAKARNLKLSEGESPEDLV